MGYHPKHKAICIVSTPSHNNYATLGRFSIETLWRPFYKWETYRMRLWYILIMKNPRLWWPSGMQLFGECTVTEAKLLDFLCSLVKPCIALHSLTVKEIKAVLYQRHKIILYITIT
jgi:hypothetical protein